MDTQGPRPGAQESGHTVDGDQAPGGRTVGLEAVRKEVPPSGATHEVQ